MEADNRHEVPALPWRLVMFAIAILTCFTTIFSRFLAVRGLAELDDALGAGGVRPQIVELVQWFYRDSVTFGVGYVIAVVLGVLAIIGRMRWLAAISSLTAIVTVCAMLAIPPTAFWISNKVMLEHIYDGAVKKGIVPPRKERAGRNHGNLIDVPPAA